MESVKEHTLNAEKKPRARKSNFSPEEIAIIVDEGVQHHSLLSASFGPGVTKKCKDSMWEKIASKLSANTAGVRSAGEVRKKWNDIRCQVKKRAQLMKKEASKTGGGPSTLMMTELDEKVLSTIPTCQVEGIDGGIETTLCTDEPPTAEVQTHSHEASLPQESAAVLRTLESVDGVSTITTSMASAASSQKTPTTRAMSMSSTIATSASTVTVNPRSGSTSHVECLMKVEQSKLEVLQQLLCVETERLAVERERLVLERQRLAIDQQRLEKKERMFNSNVENFVTLVISFD